jgi:hypothetical protein
MKALPGIVLLGTVVSGAAHAHDPITTTLTWSKEISRVVYLHCAGCHRPQGRAMSLLTYEDARPWAKAIRDEVLNRRMPPWGPVKGVGEFRGDPSLSQPEMDLLVSWVEGGAPEGNPAYLPAVVPGPDKSVDTPAGGVEVRDALTLNSGITLRSITPSGAVEVVAALPGGQVQRLLWVRDFQPAWNRAYALRTPLLLPRGTKLLVYGAPVRLR